jgi:hypothetical protein
MKRLPVVFGSLATLVLYASIASAQAAQAGQAPAAGRGQGAPAGRGPAAPAGGAAQGAGRGAQAPQPTKNLQVLPKEYTVQQVVPIMQGVAQALGVGCEHCHNFIAPGNPMNDFAADDKPEKNKGRVMMRMVTNINQTLVAQVGKPAADLVQVTCVTCHRGVPVPKQLVDIVVDLGNQAQGGGTAAAITKYRDLRKQFYGSQAYDFSDFTLFTAAQRANTANKPDDAIAYAQANLEFNPTSARSYQVMSQSYTRKMDTMNAIAMMEKAVAADPMNMQFQNQLNQLKNPNAGRGGAGGGAGQGGGQGRGQ